jgi:hypothetical protein
MPCVITELRSQGLNGYAVQKFVDPSPALTTKAIDSDLIVGASVIAVAAIAASVVIVGRNIIRGQQKRAMAIADDEDEDSNSALVGGGGASYQTDFEDIKKGFDDDYDDAAV